MRFAEQLPFAPLQCAPATGTLLVPRLFGDDGRQSLVAPLDSRLDAAPTDQDGPFSIGCGEKRIGVTPVEWRD
jgi:hypothetical protein